MSKNLHIVNRGGVFYWRRRLPRSFATAFGCKQLRISLRSRDPKAARRLANILSVHFDRFLHHMDLERRLPSKDEQQEILKQLYRYITDSCRTVKACLVHPDDLPGLVDYLTSPDLPVPTEEPVFVSDEWLNFYASPSESAARLRESYANNQYGLAQWLLESILATRAIGGTPDDVDFRKFLQSALRIGVRALEDSDAELYGETMSAELEYLVGQARREEATSKQDVPFAYQAPNPPATSPAKVANSALVSSFIEGYCREMLAHDSWTAGTERQNRNSLSLMIRIIGDKAVDEVGRADASKLRRTLEQLPATLGKSRHHQDMPIEKIIAQMSAHEKSMSETTLDRHWRTIVAFMTWLGRQDGVPDINIDRIFGGFKWSKAVPKEEERVPWESDLLRCLFSSPIWTGFRPHPTKRYWRHEAGGAVVKDEYWWLPLLAVYHGTRLEELCQLKGTDIEEVDGIVCMRLRGDHLKTESSERDVPIHSAVIKLGFLELAQRAGSERIFHKMHPGGRDNRFGHAFSERFTQYRKRVGVYRERMDFHSFRHQVTTKILNANFDMLIVDELTGHDSNQRKETKSESHTYFHGFDGHILKKAIESVHYPEIDLDRLLELSREFGASERNLALRFPAVWGENPASRKRTKKRVAARRKHEAAEAAE